MSNKTGREHEDDDCLFPAAPGLALSISDDDNGALLGAVDGAMMGRRQLGDPRILAVLDHLENSDGDAPKVFSRPVNYFSLKLSNAVRHYVRSCRECQQRKVPPTLPAEILQPIEPPTKSVSTNSNRSTDAVP